MPPILVIALLAAAIFILLLGIAIMVIRALSAKTVQRPVKRIQPADLDELDLAAHLAEVLQCSTLSPDGNASSAVDSGEPYPLPSFSPFDDLHEIIFRNYPLVSQKLQREFVNDYSLLYTWQGSISDLPGVLFAAHQDVVPVDHASLNQWDYPPFSGAIAEGYVWGRGAMDVKCQMIALLDSVEHLLQQGYEPKRTVYLAFGHDEEVGGNHGAKEIAAVLKERAVKLGALIDEGAGILTEGFPGLKLPLALIGTAEKGGLTLELSVDCPPGHSSAPPPHTSIGILAQALARLEAQPLPGSLNQFKPILQALAPHSSFLQRLAFTNLWLFGGAVFDTMAKNPQTNALLRTTTAVTMIQGGIKVNILPPRAAARVNFRLAPGDTVAGVLEHVRKAVADERVKIERPNNNGREASAVSPSDSPAYLLLSDTIQQIFGDTPVAPVLVTGATDSRHYTPICRNIYRFSPLAAGRDDVSRVHGIGERIRIDKLRQMAQFFVELIQAWSSADSL